MHPRKKPVNRISRPSNQSSTSPPRTDSQTPSSPAFDSPHYAPHTSTSRSQLAQITAAHSGRSAPPSTSGSPPHTPSRGTAVRTSSGTTASHSAALATPWRGMRPSGSAETSRLRDPVPRRPGDIRLAWVTGQERMRRRWRGLLLGWSQLRSGFWLALSMRARTRRRCRGGSCSVVRFSSAGYRA